MINGFINELQAERAAVRPVVFPGLSENKRPFTDFETLTDD